MKKQFTSTRKQALDRLKGLAWERKREQYPNIPDYALTVYKYSDATANGLTRCIIDYIKLMGYQAERISTTGRPLDQRTTYVDAAGFVRQIGTLKWIPGSGTKGSADISATVKGQSWKIEVKIGKDIQSDAQRQYQQAIEKAGGVYFIATDFGQFYEFYHSKINTP